MTASHSEIRTVMQEIQEAREKEKTDEWTTPFVLGEGEMVVQ
jgi:hypothetical protein